MCHDPDYGNDTPTDVRSYVCVYTHCMSIPTYTVLPSQSLE